MKESLPIYSLRLTNKEVEGIGYKRWLNKHFKNFCIESAIGLAILLVVAGLIPEEWASWLKLVVLAPCAAVCFMLVIHEPNRAEKAGKELLRQVESEK
jgi:hypothetical protein